MRVFLTIPAAAPVLMLVAVSALAEQNRPAITGISHMCVYASDPRASEHFYADILGGVKGTDPQDPNGARYYFSPAQFVEVLPLPADHTISRMACVAWNAADAAALLTYLRARGAE